MKTITILSLFVTATWASTRHPRENHHVRKRSLQATTPYGNFDDQEHDYILSIIPPAMHHDMPQSSTKTTSSGKSSSSKKSKGKGGKGSKGKGSKDSSKSKGKGKGKKKSKKSSSKETLSPAPTLSPILEESAPTQTPVLAPVIEDAVPTRDPATTLAPAATPTLSTDAPTSRPTMETQQAPTSEPTPLDPASTNAPTPVDDSSTSAPTVSDTASTNVPTPLDASSTSAPTSLDTSLSSVPTAAIASSTDLPTASDETRTSAPTASTSSLTNPPTTAAEAPTAVPVALPTGDFETTLNLDQVPPQFHSVFQNAAAKWDSIIVGDLEDYPIFEEDRTNPELLCDGDSLPETVDDVFICARLPNIDGPNSILGSAGPIFGRVGDFVQTAVGYMEFDLADIEMLETQGRLDGLILHEMAHVYGTGTLWGQNGLITDTPDCPYSYDSKASEEYRALSGCDTAVPIETTGGSGTACLHWAESCFQTELMTGVNTGDQELSRLSIATLEDMGYVVDYSQADPYTVDQMDPSCVCGANLVHENEFQLSNGVSMTFHWQDNRRSLRYDASDKEREQAIQYGKKKLQDNHRSAEHMSRNTDPRRIYLADKVVLVLYFDKDEQIRSVLVTPDP